MIDHNRQVIFTHIARCGGSTIEHMFMGTDWWNINSHTKHIPAQVAKELYRPYWDQYYKFALVRNPFERIRSMWKYADHYGLSLNENREIVLDEYKRLWGFPFVCEYNRDTHRSHHRVKLEPIWYREDLDLWSGSVYGNLIESQWESSPFNIQVFKYEDFSSVLYYLTKEFGVGYWPKAVETSKEEKPRLSDEAIEDIKQMHRLDFDRYGYSKEYKN